MNDIKYVMLPRIEEKSKEIKHQPWYRERLRDKYLVKNPNGTEKILDPKQWLFIKDGLDDFRDGLPPPHDDVVLRPSKGPSPLIKNDTWKFKEFALSPTNRLNKTQRCYSKKLPLAQAKRDNIEQIIESLSQHPLALYSHLEEALPPDLFEEILDILDPEINQHNESEFNDSRFSSNEKPTSTTPSKLQEEHSSFGKKNIRDELQKLEENLKKEQADNKSDIDTRSVRNTYKWLLRKEEIKMKAKGPDQEQLKAQAIDNHIKNVTEEYCDWVKSLGGEHNIDPITLTSLFASGYDTKPPLSVPIHVVDLSNIPAELRSTAYVPQNLQNKDKPEKNIFRDDQNVKKAGFRYGAWYLPKEHWHFMRPNEKLTDPKIIRDTERKESRKKVEEINSKLAPTHGAQAFKEYIQNKQPRRIPKLLSELDEWQSENQIKSNSTGELKLKSNSEKFLHI